MKRVEGPPAYLTRDLITPPDRIRLLRLTAHCQLNRLRECNIRVQRQLLTSMSIAWLALVSRQWTVRMVSVGRWAGRGQAGLREGDVEFHEGPCARWYLTVARD